MYVLPNRAQRGHAVTHVVSAEIRYALIQSDTAAGEVITLAELPHASFNGNASNAPLRVSETRYRSTEVGGRTPIIGLGKENYVGNALRRVAGRNIATVYSSERRNNVAPLFVGKAADPNASHLTFLSGTQQRHAHASY